MSGGMIDYKSVGVSALKTNFGPHIRMTLSLATIFDRLNLPGWDF